MHTAGVIATHGDARAIDFRKAIDIIKGDPQLIGDAAAHLLPPAFRTDHALSQPDPVLHASLSDFLGQQQRVR